MAKKAEKERQELGNKKLRKNGAKCKIKQRSVRGQKQPLYLDNLLTKKLCFLSSERNKIRLLSTQLKKRLKPLKLAFFPQKRRNESKMYLYPKKSE